MRIWIASLLLVFLTGCFSFLTIEKGDVYRRDLEDIPQKGEMSFASKEALAAGATLQNKTAAKVYYEGTEPLSPDASILYEMSYRFLGLVGVNMDFDPSDPESVKAVFAEADKALEEKDGIIHKLENDVQDFNRRLAEEQKIRKTKEEEAVTWRSRVWALVWGVISVAVGIVALAGILQTVTGIPFLKGLFGLVKTMHATSKQTIAGVQEMREKLRAQAEASDNEEYRRLAAGILREMDQTLDKHQDAGVKMHIRRLKNGG